jgi:pimeloyl-ACP methyl ester carboxylesterase
MPDDRRPSRPDARTAAARAARPPGGPSPTGDGRTHPTTVLVLHGIYGTGRLWDGLRRALDPARFRVVAPDLVGHGESAGMSGPLDAIAIAEALVPLLETEVAGRFHVVGHSHGGAAAQVLARRFPDRVASLALVSTYTRQPLAWWERVGGRLAPPVVRLGGALGGARALPLAVRLTRSGGGGRRLSGGAARELARQMATNDMGQMARALAAAREFDSRPWLAEIRAPTLVVSGDDDRFVSRRQSELLADGIPGARLVTVRGGGHIVPLSHPDRFEHLVSRWLDEVEGQLGDQTAGPDSAAPGGSGPGAPATGSPTPGGG